MRRMHDQHRWWTRTPEEKVTVLWGLQAGWDESLVVTGSDPTQVEDVDDDLGRELAFYNQVRANVTCSACCPVLRWEADVLIDPLSMCSALVYQHALRMGLPCGMECEEEGLAYAPWAAGSSCMQTLAGHAGAREQLLLLARRRLRRRGKLPGSWKPRARPGSGQTTTTQRW